MQKHAAKNRWHKTVRAGECVDRAVIVGKKPLTLEILFFFFQRGGYGDWVSVVAGKKGEGGEERNEEVNICHFRVSVIDNNCRLCSCAELNICRTTPHHPSPPRYLPS